MARLRLLLCLLALAFPPRAVAQDDVFAALTTDREEYAYGETVELTYTITNGGEETFTVWGSSSCIVGFAWSTFVHPGEGGGCTADDRPFDVVPGGSMSWVWRIVPAEHAVPETGGEQTIWAGVNVVFDPISVEHAILPASATISVPKYLGGRLALRLAEGLTLDDVPDVLEALNATVIQNWPSLRHYDLEIEGTTVADAMATYEDDERIMWMEIIRPIEYARITSATHEEPGPTVAELSAAHPNPFTTAATLTLTPPHPGPARVEAFDVLGRRVAVLHDGPLPAGAVHSFTLDAGGLPAGVYIVRATGAGYAFSRRVTLTR